MIHCPVCQAPLGELELSLNQKWHYDCQKCEQCGGPITIEMMNNWIEGTGTREHSTCRDARLEKEILTKEVTIKQSHLDYLNKIRLLCWIDPQKDTIENVRDAEIQFRALAVDKMSIEDLQKFRDKWTNIAALVSIALHASKDRILVETARVYREKTKEQKEQEKSKTRTEEIKKAQLQAERLDPKLRERRKAIEGLKRTFPNMTDQQIEEMLGGVKQ